jgi:murein hydrolase activator
MASRSSKTGAVPLSGPGAQFREAGSKTGAVPLFRQVAQFGGAAAKRGTAPLFALLLALVLPLHSQQPPTDRARAEAAARRAKERLQVLQQEADALVSQEQTLLVELRKLEVDRQIKIEELAEIDGEMNETQRRLTEATNKAETLRKTAAEQQPDVEARLVQLYKLGRAGYWRLMLDVDDLRSLGRAYRTAAALTEIDRHKIQEHQRTLAALENERKALEARTKEIAVLQERAAAARAAIERTVAARSKLVDEIDARRDLTAQLIGELQAAQQKLQASLSKLDAEGPHQALTLPLRPFQGTLPWPLRGTVSQRFGSQTKAQSGATIARNGIELTVAEGQPVRAVHDGTVAFADRFTGYGNLVIVDHGNQSYSLYGHLSSLNVTRGDAVAPQSELGLSGLNPSGHPALYFELRVDGKAVDPLQWLKKS